jgi:hypothetical protein
MGTPMGTVIRDTSGPWKALLLTNSERVLAVHLADTLGQSVELLFCELQASPEHPRPCSCLPDQGPTYCGIFALL